MAAHLHLPHCFGWLVLPALLATAALDIALASTLEVAQATPSLLAIFAIALVLCSRHPLAFLAAGSVGLLVDLCGTGRGGVCAAGWLCVGYGLCRLRPWLPADRPWLQATITWPAVTLVALSTACLHRLFGETSALGDNPIMASCGVGFYTAAVSWPVFMLFSWFAPGSSQSTKHEIRNPKQSQNTNEPMNQTQSPAVSSI